MVAVRVYERYRDPGLTLAGEVDPVEQLLLVPGSAEPESIQYQCDGRTYCSEMTSCAEATFFIQNCPGVKMDGDRDGVPCESQWCN